MKKSIAIMFVFCITLIVGAVFEQSRAAKISIDPSPDKVIPGDPGQQEVGVLTITKTYRYEINTSEAEKKPVAGCTADIRKRHDLEDVVEATVKINLKSGMILTDYIANEKVVSYDPVSAEITRFTLNYNETKYNFRNTSGGACDSSRGNESTLTNRRVVINKPEIFGLLGPGFAVVFDSTNKAVRMWPRALAINYGYTETESLNSRQWPENDPTRSYTKSWNMKLCMLEIDPVEKEDVDPDDETNSIELREYMKGKIRYDFDNIPDMPIYLRRQSSINTYKDLIVKTGDGLTNFGGEGHKVTEKQVKGGTEREELTFKWDMKLNNKK
jgi:hypothetical protein